LIGVMRASSTNISVK